MLHVSFWIAIIFFVIPFSLRTSPSFMYSNNVLLADCLFCYAVLYELAWLYHAMLSYVQLNKRLEVKSDIFVIL